MSKSSVGGFRDLADIFSDDPFNQTIAENKDWLEAFKRDVGITSDGM